MYTLTFYVNLSRAAGACTHVRALRIIFNDFESNHDALSKRTDRPVFYISRLRAVALETYKILMKQNPPFLRDL